MNRFRKHKKEKEKEKVKEVLEDVDNGPAQTTTPVFSLKSKKKESEPEPELDFSIALPSTDNFRTSLLMPKLSARFSMLREQDDPESKLGKASDDSVLFPKRASRLNIFGHNPSMLADIDEVSLNDGSRPSLALGRTDSYASGGDAGYGTDDDRSQNGSMMSRARRAEGNNLFGGRQKVYRIPVRSPGGTSPAAESPRGMGKVVYEHDLNMSAFQRLRLKEKHERAAAEEAARESAAHEYEDANSTISTQRTTYSSTASGPATDPRTSTAATSIDESQFSVSQPQASIPAADPQADFRSPSAMSTPKTGSIRSHRLYGQGLTQAAQNQQSSTLHRLESLSRQRSGTPDLQPMNRNFSRSASNLRDRLQRLNITEPTTMSRPTSPPLSERISPTAAAFGSAPPLSPPSSETEDGASLLAAALNPEDHGKATAMGLFNRPATGFDEQAFARRQLQMQLGRDTPPLRRPSSPPRRPLPQEPVGRQRGLSKSSYRSRAESASSHYSSDAHHGIDDSRASSVEASPGRPGMTTFYATSTASESGDEGDDRRSYELSSATSQATEYGPWLHHPSIASKPPTPTGDHLETLPEVRYSDLGDLKPIEENDVVDEPHPSDNAGDITPERPDSPLLHGLSGIRSHLRHPSDKSSIYRPPSPGLPAQDPNANRLGIEEPIPEQSRRPSAAEHLRDEDMPSSAEQREASSRGSEDSSESTSFPGNGSDPNVASWKDELVYHHRRDGSTETQKEREEFAIELAERRRKVQEKLRSVAESESRSSSPTPGRSTTEIKPGNAFSLLKYKASKQELPKQDQKNNIYGYNNSSTPALPSDDFRREEERPSFSFGLHSNSSSPHFSERPLQPRMPTLSRGSRDASRESSHSRDTSPVQRDRSGSGGSGRSKSRTRYRDRDDLETVEEGAVIAHENFVIPDNFEPPMPASVPGSTRPSIEGHEPGYFDRSASSDSGRYRSTSRSGTPSFQYERPFQYQQSHQPSMIGVSPRPSPVAPPYSANATPPLNEDQSPATSVGSSASLPQRAPGHNMLQKRSVNKKLISEPTLVSCTSNVPTVGLPGGAGSPPVPPMNPRRRRGTQTILSAFKHDSSRVSSPAPSISDEVSVFPDDETRRPRSNSHSRNRLRKTSSEGGSLNARARQEAMAGPVPAVPSYPPPAIPAEGGMF
ncbi:uncharacterized protein N7498_002228 [Penicillium cinerascens]|uniref:Uncharacterized protein n=1 Tax=Penicillium cinerascens TaxID=70096 RepID=A0A9W9N9T7_9EURO|nr:uncharacterized protein N7498_002228 [Penicillium cinerascens]KAJ5215821.1 hypothetical protein N7498_002228 [Penicillium cinerascens]